MSLSIVQNFDGFRDDHAAIWADCLKFLRPAIDRLHGTHNDFDILCLIHQGMLTLWAGDYSAAVTEIQIYPRKRVCNVFLVGGVGGLEEVDWWCRPGGSLEVTAFSEWDCDRIHYTGRKGWRKLKHYTVIGETGMRDRP